MEHPVISCAVVKVRPGCPQSDLREQFLLPGDWLFACAIRLQNTCCYTRTMILPFVPDLDFLAWSYLERPENWQFAAAGNLTL